MALRTTSRQHDQRARDKIECMKLIGRLQKHVHGELLLRPEVGRRIVAELLRELNDTRQPDTPEIALSQRATESLERRVMGVIAQAGMDMTQVRAAEVLLKKRLPDLAMLEVTGEVRQAHVVQLPGTVTPEAWAKALSRGKDHEDAPALVIEHERA
jgi:hypothetical protein